jgi:HD-like signal output (HDOD) protein
VTQPATKTPASAPRIVRRGGAPDRLALGALIGRSLELPTVPDIAAKVVRAVEDPELTVADIAGMIETDQGITAKIIKTSNSSLYGFSRKVENLQSAIALLGFVEVRNLVVAASTRYLYRRFGPTEKGLWRHSVATAVCTRMVAAELAPSARGAAYLAGQMHDMGKVVMNNADPNRFAETEASAGGGAKGGDLSPVAAELRTFGFTHADVGALVAEQWRMPAAIEAACFYHHDLAMGRAIAPDAGALIACVVLADGICHRLGFGTAPIVAALDEDERDALDLFGATEERLERMMKDFDLNFRNELSL